MKGFLKPPSKIKLFTKTKFSRMESPSAVRRAYSYIFKSLQKLAASVYTKGQVLAAVLFFISTKCKNKTVSLCFFCNFI